MGGYGYKQRWIWKTPLHSERFVGFLFSPPFIGHFSAMPGSELKFKEWKLLLIMVVNLRHKAL